MFKTSAGILCAILLAGCNSKQAVTPAALEAAQPAAQQAPAIVLPQGTLLHVRLAETLDTRRNRTGDRFKATLDSPVTLNDQIVIPKNASFSGRVDTPAVDCHGAECIRCPFAKMRYPLISSCT